MNITVYSEITIKEGHDITNQIKKMLLNNVAYLSGTTIHVDPMDAADEYLKRKILWEQGSYPCIYNYPIFAMTRELIPDFFGITIDSLRVAGRILLFYVAFDMMLAKVSCERVTDSEINISLDRSDLWIFPIAFHCSLEREP